MLITSVNNPKISQVCKLSDKKFRRLSGLYVIEGERLVRDALKYGADVDAVFVKESLAEKFDFENQTLVSDKVFDKMSDTVSSQGVLAVVKKPQRVLCAPKGNCLVLDGLQDPGNVGTLIRTAAACGFTDVYAVSSVDVYSPKVLRSAMSAHFCVTVWQLDSMENLFEVLKDCVTVAADMNGENVFETDFPEKVALILGNEGNGLSDFTRQRAEKCVSLPMSNDFESLNVAVAGSVIMYRIYQK